MSDVSVIGLGQMGSKLVELLHANGRTVTLWNRSGVKADILKAEGVFCCANSDASHSGQPGDAGDPCR